MWNKESQPEVPGTSPSKDSKIPAPPLNTAPPAAPALPLRARWRAWDPRSW